MKNRRSYTLIEIMVVMALAAVLVTISLPAFSALMRGNSAAITCSKVKGVLDQAQARAVTDRRYVATVIDMTGAVSGLANTQALRNCYVSSGYAFQSWVEESEWVPLDQDAQVLVFGLGESGSSPTFPNNGSTPVPAANSVQTVGNVVGAGGTHDLSGWVFSMYGAVKEPHNNFYIGVGEATLANGVYIYKNVDGSGRPGNVMALTVNHFTGRSQVAAIGSDGKIE